jgi:hypothetical protein
MKERMAPCCVDSSADWRPLNGAQRWARLIVGVALLSLALALPSSAAVWIALAIVAGWLGATHVLDGLSGLPRTGGGAQSSARPLGEDQLQPLAMVGCAISPDGAMSADAGVRRLDVPLFDWSNGLVRVVVAKRAGRAKWEETVIELTREFDAQRWLKQHRRSDGPCPLRHAKERRRQKKHRAIDRRI